jgi:hypothetical protein
MEDAFDILMSRGRFNRRIRPSKKLDVGLTSWLGAGRVLEGSFGYEVRSKVNINCLLC